VLGSGGMSVKNYRDLDAWRLAEEIREKVISFTANSAAWECPVFVDTSIHHTVTAKPASKAAGL